VLLENNFSVLLMLLNKEELHNLHTSSNMIQVIESNRTRWAGNVAHMGEKRNAFKILVGKNERKA
jgi:hypothetical protein